MLIDLELGQWGDGSIRLAYWDHLEGKDRIFVLLGDGTAREATSMDENNEELIAIDLIATLRAMAMEGGDTPGT